MKTQGLRQRILAAASVEEIDNLLNEGKTYEFASTVTRNSWKSAGRRRTAALKGEVLTKQQPIEEVEEVDAPKKKKRGNKKKDTSIINA